MRHDKNAIVSLVTILSSDTAAGRGLSGIRGSVFLPQEAALSEKMIATPAAADDMNLLFMNLLFAFNGSARTPHAEKLPGSGGIQRHILCSLSADHGALQRGQALLQIRGGRAAIRGSSAHRGFDR